VGMYFSDDASVAIVASGYAPSGLLAESFEVPTGGRANPSISESGRRAAHFVTRRPYLCDQFLDANDRWMLVGTTWDIGYYSTNCEPAPARLYDTDTQLVAELPFQTGPAKFGPPRTIGADLVAWTDTDQVALYDLVGRRPIGSFPGSGFDLEQPSFSPDGSLLAFGSESDGAYVVDIREVLDGTPMEDAVALHVEFDGSVARPAVVGTDTLVTAHDSQKLAFWDLDTGDRVMTLDNPTGHSPVLAFTPDERYFYYEAPGNVMRRMPMDVDELVALARAQVQREFTVEECATYFPAGACFDVT